MSSHLRGAKSHYNSFLCRQSITAVLFNVRVMLGNDRVRVISWKLQIIKEPFPPNLQNDVYNVFIFTYIYIFIALKGNVITLFFLKYSHCNRVLTYPM